MMMRSPALCLLLTGPCLLAGALLPIRARAQTTPVLPNFFGTYVYTAYIVYDYTTPEAPTQVSGVGGTLTMRPDGTYEKHLSIVAPSGPYYFNQAGTYATTGDSIRFAFIDAKGPDVQRGTFRLDSLGRRLTVTILGYPAGNKGVYELVVDELSIPVEGTKSPPRPQTSKKRRR